jgi:outer membrane protein
MRKVFSISILAAALWFGPAPTLFAQASGQTLRLSVDDAVTMALEHNVDLAAARLDPQIDDTRTAAASGAFRPTFSTSLQRNNQLQPPASFLVPVATRTDAVTSGIGLAQKLPWFGTSYSVSWNAAHTDSNSFLNSYNPILQSGLALSVSQPVVRDLPIDRARQELATSRLERDVAGARLRETVVQTTAQVKAAYWNLVSAIAHVDARQSALALAEELVRVNKAKVSVGDAPPLDLVAAQAEVAADREQLIIAQTAVKHVEDQLRALIFDTRDRSVWNVRIDPADAPPLAMASPDLDLAVANALRDRADLARARKDIDRARIDVKFAANQKLPDVRLNASYLASGLGGTQLLRAGGFPGTILGPGADTGFASVLNQVFTGKYSTWSMGVSINYPLGQAVEQANYARSRLEQARSEEQLKSAESRVVQQVRDAWRKIEMNAERIETARAARGLADERLDAERKRYAVGMSTSFLVIQAQRDLTQARTNELAATLAYALALVDFDAVQQGRLSPTGPDLQSSLVQ